MMSKANPRSRLARLTCERAPFLAKGQAEATTEEKYTMKIVFSDYDILFTTIRGLI